MTKPITSFQNEYQFLSNFYGVPVLFRGIEFKTAEHAYQAMKMTNIFDFLAIAECTTPGRAKRLAKKFKHRGAWPVVAISIMTSIVTAKFSNPILGTMLLLTGDSHIEEGNNWGDRFWGTVDGEGQNHLGKILMNIREELQEEMQNE